jgi:hypothetical protein
MKHEPAFAQIHQPDIADLRAVRGALRVWLCELVAWFAAMLPQHSRLGAAIRIALTGELRVLERDVKLLAFDYAWLRIEVRRTGGRVSARPADHAPPGFRIAFRKGSGLRRVTRGVFPGTVGVAARMSRIRRALDAIERVATRIVARILRRPVLHRIAFAARPGHVLPRFSGAAAPAGADTS